MDKLKINSAKRITGAITVPPDKSISHRAVIFGAIAEGMTRIENALMAEDCIRTIEAFRQMGVEIKVKGERLKVKGQDKGNIEIYGKGLYGFKKPKKPIYCGNSGTTMRLLSGILAGQDFQATLTGDESLSSRPMSRIAAPLKMMGADIRSKVKGSPFALQHRKMLVGASGDRQRSRRKEIYPPLAKNGGRLKAIDYAMSVASAQVKSCVLLAGLYADGVTSVVEPAPSRDHTERMLRLFGAGVAIKGLKVSIKPGQRLKAARVYVPADISSAAFFIVAASIVKTSKLTIKNVGVNPTRTGILDVMKQMGAKIRVTGLDTKNNFEPTADLVIESANLKAVTIKGGILPRLIDELPIIMVAATQAKGTTKIIGAKELRVKETDRIKSMTTGLAAMGACITVKGDDIYIKGPIRLKGARVRSYGDHRTAMSLAVAGLAAEGETIIEDTACILTSFPNFQEILSDILLW